MAGFNKYPIFSSAYFGNYAQGNYTEFDTKGQLRSHGDATQYDDIRIATTSTTRGGSNDPDFTRSFRNGSSQGVFTWYFSPTTEEELYFTVQLPHNWEQGTDIYPHVHWFVKSNGGVGQDVCWGLEYTWANVGDSFSTTNIIYGDVNHLGEDLISDIHYITELGTLSGVGKQFSSMIICRIFRDATGTGGIDDYNADAGLLEIDFHYKIDSLGSDEEYVKYD